jgi:hypothetical protein
LWLSVVSCKHLLASSSTCNSQQVPSTLLLLLLLPLWPQAGEQLGLRSLQEHCAHLKGTRQAALGVYSFADVQRANASGKVRADAT